MQQPYFLNEAGNKKMKDGIMLWYAGKNPFIKSISGTDVTVHSTYNGEPVTQNYPSLNNAAIALQADPNTEVYIEGTITNINNQSSETRIVCHSTALTNLSYYNCPALTSLDLSANTALTNISCSSCPALTSLDLSANTALTSLSCSSCPALTSLDLSANTALTSLDCHSCYALTLLDLSANTALTSLSCYDCYGLTSLDLSANTALTSLSCYSCPALTSLDLSANTALTSLNCDHCNYIETIKYVAQNTGVATKIAGLISEAFATDGNVYCKGTYSSTVQTAATSKGWTYHTLE